jgi:hypothetical protein
MSNTSRTTECRDRATWDRWTPQQRLDACLLDNVCSCIRKSVWRTIPFRATPIAEDVEWARDVLLAGHRLAYAADALIEHSHDRSAGYELRRTWILHQRLYRLVGMRTIPTMANLARAVASSAVLHARLVSSSNGSASLSDHVHGLALACAWPLGQYLGGWTAAHGRDRWRPGGV